MFCQIVNFPKANISVDLESLQQMILFTNEGKWKSHLRKWMLFGSLLQTITFLAVSPLSACSEVPYVQISVSSTKYQNQE